MAQVALWRCWRGPRILKKGSKCIWMESASNYESNDTLRWYAAWKISEKNVSVIPPYLLGKSGKSHHYDRFSKSWFSDGSVGRTECFNNIEFKAKYMPNKSVEVRRIVRFWVCSKCTSIYCQKIEYVSVSITHIISIESNKQNRTINLYIKAIQLFDFPMLLQAHLLFSATIPA